MRGSASFSVAGLCAWKPRAFIANCDSAWGRKNNLWDDWSRERLSSQQIQWISSWREKEILDSHILLIHGAYDVSYDLLPGIPLSLARSAFAAEVTPDITDVWFGHYHYDFEIASGSCRYHSLRPVGHHRDHDIRASYYIYENGALCQYCVCYDIEKTIRATNKIDCLKEPLKTQWLELLRNGFEENLLRKDTKAMEDYCNC